MASETESVAIDGGVVAANGRSGAISHSEELVIENQNTQHGASDSTGRGGVYDKVDHKASGPSKSIEGWVIFVTGIHPEAAEDDVMEAFEEFGDIRSIHMNLDRRTGFAKGYALIEFESKDEAEAAVGAMEGKAILGKEIACDFAFFSEGSTVTRGSGGRGRGRGRGRRGGHRGGRGDRRDDRRDDGRRY